MRVLIAGCGYVGEALARRLGARGDEVFALRRRGPEVDGAARSIQADVTRPESLARLPSVDAVVYAVSAGAYDDAAYARAYVEGPRNLMSAIGGSPRFLFVSSTGAYTQADGSWVDEDTDPLAGGAPSFSTVRLLEGEREVLTSPLQATVLRLAGIYGPGRESRLDLVASGRARRPARPVWTNRIHRDDAAGALEHLLHLPDPAPLYLGVDHEPTDLADLLGWLGERLDVDVPPAGDGEAPRARGSKRCRGDRLRETGYRYRYPTFREGYDELCRARGL